MAHFDHIISTIDAHTGGEAVRVAVSGLPLLSGATMADKKAYFKNRLDSFRTLLMQEPRGHNDMFGVILTPPCHPQAHYGILFIDNNGYLTMCGHSIIGAATVLIETGMVAATEPETAIVFDTPVGLVKSTASIANQQVQSVSFTNVPAFVYAENISLHTPSFGTVSCDVAFGGNFFALVDAQTLALALTAENLPVLQRLAMEIKRGVNEVLTVSHPEHAHVDRVELTKFYQHPNPALPFSKSLVVFGSGQFDRSPCGTGVSALMALLHHQGKLALNVELTAESMIGTRFQGRLINAQNQQGISTVLPVISGSAYLTGIHQFVTEPDDPVKYGFKVG